MNEEGRRWTDRSSDSSGSIFRISTVPDFEARPIINWGSDLEVGIGIVDRQHQRLVQIFNNLVTSQSESVSAVILQTNLMELSKYTRYHFGTEEEMMRKWPITPSHKKMHLKAHQSFINFIDRAQGLADESPDDVALHVTTFLAKWLLHHIIEVDSRLAKEIMACQGGIDVEEFTETNASVSAVLVNSITEMNDNLGLRTFEVLDLNARLKAEVSRSQELVKVNFLLAEVNSAVVLANDQTDFMNQICARIVEILEVPLSWIGRPETAARFNLIAAVGDVQYMDVSPTSYATNDRAANENHGESGSNQTLGGRSELAVEIEIQGYVEAEKDQGHSSSVAFPILRNGQNWAVLTTCFQPEATVSQTVKDILGEVAKSISIGLDRLDAIDQAKKLHEQVEYQAFHDSLTGLPNRHKLDDYLPGVLESAKRNNFVVAVGMLDLDDFKMVNDTWGHQAGDVVLQNLAGRLRLRLRTGDLLARLGGDEFVIVFESTGQDDARYQMESVLHRLHQAVDAPFEVAPGCHVEIEMSLGLAVYPLDATDCETLLRQADMALYRAKATKGNRSTWWQMGSNAFAPPDFDQSFDPFGEESIGLLEGIQTSCSNASIEFVDKFYAGLALEDTAQAILSSLSVSEMESLKNSQAEHFKFVLSDATTQSQLLNRAYRLGFVHALVGVDASLMMRAFSLYRSLLNLQLAHLQIDPRSKFRLVLACESRLNEDVQAQLHAMQVTSSAYGSVLQQSMPDVATSWDEAESAELEVLSGLPGILAVAIWSRDSDGQFRAFRVKGKIGEEIVSALNRLETDGAQLTATWHSSTLARAWGSGRTLSLASLEGEENSTDQVERLIELGVRSVAVIPTFSGQRHVASVIELLGAFPNQFESNLMRQFIQGLQRRWLEIKDHLESFSRVPIVTPGLVQQYNSELFNGGLQMYMQPIVDLREASVVNFEALARLRTKDDLLIPPSVFLPLIGDTGLVRLFREGLDQVLTWMKRWEEKGLVSGVSLKVPAAALMDPEFKVWVRDALNYRSISPSRLTLELLETHRLEDNGQMGVVEGLIELGTRLAMDDLGSGYSSVLEFANLPFDIIKIDRGMTAQLYTSPLQTLTLLGRLTQLGREFGRDLIVEGLEDLGMLEAAVFLGAPSAQGFHLAFPMPPETVPDWVGGFVFPVQNGQIQTYLGALTYLLSASHHEESWGESSSGGCPLGEFLANQGVEAEEAVLLHLQIHRETTRGQGYQRLLQWFIDKVRSAL